MKNKLLSEANVNLGYARDILLLGDTNRYKQVKLWIKPAKEQRKLSEKY